MADKDVSLGISAEDAGLNAAVANAAKVVQNATSQMGKSFDSVGGSIKKMQDIFAGFTTILAGGAAFKAAVDQSVNLTKESMALGKALGISATEASVLNVALGDTYQTSESFIDSNGKMTKQLLKNEDAFKNLGVATRDSNGSFRNSVDIQMDVNNRLLEFKEGIDRNMEGIKIYGKGWDEAAQTLKLTSGVMAAAKEKSDALGLSIGQENVAATTRYRAAMNDVQDVVTAVLKATGDALLPILSRLGEWFSQIGPAAVAMTRVAMDVFGTVVTTVGTVIGELWNIASTAFSAIGRVVQAAFGGDGLTAMQVFTGAMKAVQVAVIAMRVGFEISIEAIKLILAGAAENIMRFANVAERALHLDFEGAKGAWRQGVTDIEGIVAASTARMVAIAEKGRSDMDGAIYGDATKVTTTPIERKSSGGTSGGGEAKDKPSRVPMWDAALAEEKVYYQQSNNLKEFSLDQEKAFWASILATNNASQKEKIDISRKMSGIDLEIMKKAVKDKIAMTSQTIDATEKAAMGSIALDEIRAQREVDEGYMSKRQLLDIQRNYEEQRFQIQTTAQQARIDAMKGDPNYDPVALQKLLDQMAEIQFKHALDVEKINSAMQLDVKEKWDGVLFPIRDAFDRTINGMIQGTLTWRKAMLNIGDNVAASFVKSAVNMATAWASAELRKTAATQTGSMMRALFEKMGLFSTVAAQGAASAATVTIKTGEAVAVVGANAAEGASGAAAAVADIPIVGPALAALAFAGTMAMILGAKGQISSAKGGYDIPAGINPMTQLHEREMVLPAEHADAIRNMTGGSGVTNFHIHAVDAQSFKRLLMDNGRGIADALNAQARNFYKR
ncbi:hypothetical protein [Nitrosospira briensis]|uniref:hypothetical protein n=1 Tax=Nitrosospira briensis TaxID=35799 RepID=UPI00046AD14F|nr:hypothetical protein [Nitrosospira briensis]